jgi:hypothetical protein
MSPSMKKGKLRKTEIREIVDSDSNAHLPSSMLPRTYSGPAKLKLQRISNFESIFNWPNILLPSYSSSSTWQRGEATT